MVVGVGGEGGYMNGCGYMGGESGYVKGCGCMGGE